MSKHQKDEETGMVNALLESDILHYKTLATAAENKLELAVKVLEELEFLTSYSECSPNFHENSKLIFSNYKIEAARLSP